MTIHQQPEQAPRATPSVVRIGARIEFYDRIDSERGPSSPAGSAIQEDAFDAVTVPRAGEIVSVAGLFGSSLGQFVKPWTRGPFVEVVKVEHHPCPVPDAAGNIPDPGWTTPGVVLVFHAVAPTEDWAIERLNTGLRERGWTVFPGPGEQMP